MAWIRIVDEREADEELRAVYERVVRSRGKLSNIMAVHSLSPKAMTAHMDLYMAIMFGPSGLSRREREVVAVAVSAANGCGYCIAHHAEALHHHWKGWDALQALVDDPAAAELAPRTRSLVDYALKLTRTPGDMTETDVQGLRQHGMSDGDVLTLNLVVSYFNFVNRIALGLGVEKSAEEVSGYRH